MCVLDVQLSNPVCESAHATAHNAHTLRGDVDTLLIAISVHRQSAVLAAVPGDIMACDRATLAVERARDSVAVAYSALNRAFEIAGAMLPAACAGSERPAVLPAIPAGTITDAMRAGDITPAGVSL